MKELSAVSAIIESLTEIGEIPIRDARFGPYWNAVMSRRCGLASTPHISHEDAGQAPSSVHREEVIGRPAIDIARWTEHSDPHKAAVGLAAINSLIEPDLARCVEMNARDVLLQRAPRHRVALIGHFPFTEELRAAAGEFWVLELHPRPGDLPAEKAPEVLPLADIVAITGVTLINHTFDTLIRLCRPDAFVVMLGGSTPLSPVLFDFGVDVAGGTVVDDPQAVMADIAAGATFRQLRGKRPVLLFKEPPAR